MFFDTDFNSIDKQQQLFQLQDFSIIFYLFNFFFLDTDFSIIFRYDHHSIGISVTLSL